MQDNLYREKTEGYFALARKEIEPLLPAATERVLEIGCGAGATVSWLRSIRPVAFAAGVEMENSAAIKATAVMDSVITGNVETETLPFAPASFDLILALDVLEHLVDPWAVVQRLHGLLKPGGSIIASIPNIGHYSALLPLVLHGRWDYRHDGILDRTHLRFFVEETARSLMMSSGLTIDGFEYVRNLPWWARWGIPTRLARRWVARLFRINPLRRLTDFQFLVRAKRSI